MKKKLIIITAFAGMIALLSSCLSTLHPLFTEKDLVFDPRLVGMWSSRGDNDGTILIKKGSAESFGDLPEALRALADKAYYLTVNDHDGTLSYYAFLVRIGDDLYFDYYPAQAISKESQNEFFRQHLVKLHSLYHVDFIQNGSFRMKQFDERFLTDLIRNKKIRISHEVMFDGSYLITASTAELQQYVIKYGDVPEAYYGDNTETYYKVQ
jgi:hypothetical protein